MKDLTNEYLKFFHFAVTAGLACGLEHPIEWAANAWRTPGGTLSEEYYRDARQHIPLFLVEAYEDINTTSKYPTNSSEILEWCDSHYHQNKMMQGFFLFLKDNIQETIDERREERNRGE